MPTFSPEDEGTPVLDINDNRIGMITRVEDRTAYIEFESGIPETLASTLGFGGTENGPYPLRDEMVDRVYDDKIRLRGDHSEG